MITKMVENIMSGPFTEPPHKTIDQYVETVRRNLISASPDCSGCWDEKEYLHTCGKANDANHPLMKEMNEHDKAN